MNETSDTAQDRTQFSSKERTDSRLESQLFRIGVNKLYGNSPRRRLLDPVTALQVTGAVPLSRGIPAGILLLSFIGAFSWFAYRDSKN